MRSHCVSFDARADSSSWETGGPWGQTSCDRFSAKHHRVRRIQRRQKSKRRAQSFFWYLDLYAMKDRREQHTVLGIVPARSGSKGIAGKNIRTLGGKPLLAYTASAAL